MPELSYEEIVDHIVSDKPIPNVVSVPDITLNESMRTVSQMGPRRKPWEFKEVSKDDENLDDSVSELLTAFGKNRQTDLQEQVDVIETNDLSSYHAREAEFDAAINSSTNNGECNKNL